jgi:hypothetical protein
MLCKCKLTISVARPRSDRSKNRDRDRTGPDRTDFNRSDSLSPEGRKSKQANKKKKKKSQTGREFDRLGRPNWTGQTRSKSPVRPVNRKLIWGFMAFFNHMIWRSANLALCN